MSKGEEAEVALVRRKEPIGKQAGHFLRCEEARG